MKKLKNRLAVSLLFGGLLGTAWNGVPGFLEIISNLSSNKIKGEEITRVVREKETKLNIKDKRITITGWKPKGNSLLTPSAKYRRIGENEYEIEFRDETTSKTIIRHELYHIADGHCDESLNSSLIEQVKYWFKYEPQAMIYSSTELKL